MIIEAFLPGPKDQDQRTRSKGPEPKDQDWRTRAKGPGPKEQDQRTRTKGPGPKNQDQRTRTKGPGPKDQNQRTRTKGPGPKDQDQSSDFRSRRYLWSSVRAVFAPKEATSGDYFIFVESLWPLEIFVRYSWYCHKKINFRLTFDSSSTTSEREACPQPLHSGVLANLNDEVGKTG